MKAKNLFLSSALLLTMLSGCSTQKASLGIANQHVLRASNWSDFEEGSHVYGSSYQIPSMSYTLDGTSYKATVIVTYPDQTQSAETEISLTQAGVYTFEYSVNVNGEIHNITEKINVGFPQAYVGNAEKSSIKYINEEESKAMGGKGTSGLYVKLGLGDTLNFTKPIYLDEMNDVNALIRGYIAPSSKGSADFSQLYFKLTDADDSSKFVILCYYSHIETNSNGTTSHSSSGIARSDAQPYFAGIHQSQGLHTNDTWGLWSGVSFDGYMLDKNAYGDYIDEVLFCFGLDYDTKTVYGTGFGKGAILDTVLDLDDANQVSSLWSGFSSNRAFLSVYAESYASTTANFVITDIGGVSASELKENSFVDSDAPEITLTESSSPTTAVMGYSYPIPSASAYDQVSLSCDVTTEVFYNYFSSDRTSVKITDGKFFMDKQGTYTIRYTAYDKAGNKAEKLHTVSVLDSLDEIEFDLPVHETSMHVGEYVSISNEVSAKGGVGEKSVKAYYEVDGKKTLIEGDGFRLTELKDYKVIYEVSDLIGQSVSKEYTISVSDGGKPILEKKIVYPRYFVSGGYYDFPEEKVYLYENGKLEEKQLTLEVKDSSGTKSYSNEQYCPNVASNLDKVTVTAKYGDTVLQSDEIVAIKNIGTKESARSINLANYFVSEGLSKELTADEGIILTSTSSEAGFTFATPCLLDSFTLDLKSLEGFSKNGGIVIRLSDYANPSKEIEMRLSLIEDATYFSVGDKKAELLNNTINVGGNSYSISYEDGSFTCGDYSFPVSNFADGSAFTGFDSMKAYMSLEFVNCSAGAKLNLTSYCQSGFSSKSARDRVSPVVQMDSNYGGTKSINSVYHIDPAYSFDVLSPNVTFSLSVTSPSGEYMKASDGTVLQNADPSKAYDITLSEYGQYYFTLTSIEDPRFLSNGTEITISYYIRVYDDIAPTLSFSRGMASEAKVGETVYLPKFTASDNETSSENLIIQRSMLTPSGVYHYLDSSYNAYTFKEEGDYRFTIHVIDEAGNFATKTFLTHVSKA